MKEINCKLFIFLFFLVCLIPFAGMLILGPSEPAANEILSAQPRFTEIDGTWNPEVLSEMSDWFNDRFFLRQKLSAFWAKLNAFLFHVSVREKVVLGKNGWLYFADTVDDYTGKELSDSVIESAADHLAEIWEYCRQNQIQFVFAAAPNKNSLYPENMPPAYPNAENRNLTRLLEKLTELGVPYADIHEAFRNSEELLYYRTDSHWNEKGAALAADTILASLGMETGYALSEFSDREPHQGDLYTMLYPTMQDRETGFHYLPGFTFSCVTDSRNGEAIEFRTECAAGQKKLLCFRDSFGNSLFPFLAEKFAVADFSRSAEYDLQRIADGEYDAVIIEIVERNISWLARISAS